MKLTKAQKFQELNKLIKRTESIYNKVAKLKLAFLKSEGSEGDGLDTDELYKVEYDLINALNELRAARYYNEPF